MTRYYHYTGYWDDSNSGVEYTPDEALKEFVSGEKPVFVGFGSMTEKESDSLKQIIIKAANKYKKKIILQSGWMGFSKDDLPENVFLVDYIPHSWLFRQVSGVVIHGGAGTLASALKVGIPIFVVPFGSDQFYWGSKIHAKKCGPKPVPRINITSDLLLEGIYELENPEYIENAKKASEAIALENGVAAASDLIEKYYKEYKTRKIGR